MLFMTGLAGVAAATSESLEKLLSEAKIVDPNNKIRVSLDLPNALASISTYEETAASESDCKISAVFMAKKVMDAVPELSHVRVLFFEAQNPTRYREATVRRGDIKAFDSGQLDKKSLLSSIELLSGTTSGAESRKSNSAGVVDGPLAAKRLRLRASIEELKEKGVNVVAYNASFSKLEDLVSGKTDEQKIGFELEKLERAVNEQLKVKSESATTAATTVTHTRAALQEGNTYYKQAQASFVKGDYNNAIKALSSAIYAKPDEASYFLFLGYSYAHRGLSSDYKAAETAYQRAGALNPNEWHAFDYLGDLYFKQMRYGEARDMYNKTLTMKGVDPGEIAEIRENMKTINQQLTGTHPDDWKQYR